MISDYAHIIKGLPVMYLIVVVAMCVEIIDAGTYAGMANWNINYWAYNMGGGEGPGHLVHFTTVGNEMWASYIANELDNKFYETEL